MPLLVINRRRHESTMTRKSLNASEVAQYIRLVFMDTQYGLRYNKRRNILLVGEYMNIQDSNYFAVIDTETNFDDEVISIGVVIADRNTFEPVDRLYCILSPEYQKPAMYSYALSNERAPIDAIVDRKESIRRVQVLLQSYQVQALFAYNARFDKGHLPEFMHYPWYDILRLAAYRQYNHAIPTWCECCCTGRMKRGYNAEAIYKMLSGNRYYAEVHNALTDAEDELTIMRLLGHDIQVYEIARI